jgi:hypothetical protein
MADHPREPRRDPFDPDNPNDFVDRRHQRIARGVARSQRGVIPTWVYALVLVALIGAWIAYVVLD